MKKNEKKREKKKSWCKFELSYCPIVLQKKEICIAILVLYCNLRCALDGFYCNIVFLVKNYIAREGLRAGKKNCIAIHYIVLQRRRLEG